MVIAAQRNGDDVDSLSFHIAEALCRDDRDIANKEVLRALAMSINIDAEKLLKDAMLPGIQDEYERNSIEGVKKGVFGSPFVIADGEPFFGVDRFEILDEWLVTEGF